jgi:hypothetical protein
VQAIHEVEPLYLGLDQIAREIAGLELALARR